jgi:hypothetical protein
MSNHNPAEAIRKLLPYAEASQKTFHLLAERNPDLYQGDYEDCRHAVSYAYETLNVHAPDVQPQASRGPTRISNSDLGGLNSARAELAATMLRHFPCRTLADVLGDLIHWCDRNAIIFDQELSRARTAYEAETAPEVPAPPHHTEDTAPQHPPTPPPVEAEPDHATTTKKTYRAEFFTAADYAYRNFEAESPEQALELARRFYDEDSGELDFRSYDDNAGLDQIQIRDSERGTLASWVSDDYCQRQAAGDLLAALNLVIPHYAEFLRGVGANPDDSDAYQKALAAVAKATPPHHPT